MIGKPNSLRILGYNSNINVIILHTAGLLASTQAIRLSPWFCTIGMSSFSQYFATTKRDDQDMTVATQLGKCSNTVHAATNRAFFIGTSRPVAMLMPSPETLLHCLRIIRSVTGKTVNPIVTRLLRWCLNSNWALLSPTSAHSFHHSLGAVRA